MDFIYTVDPESDEPKMLINQQIGDEIETDEAGNVVRIIPGVSGATFERELRELERLGKRRIEIWINSPGGSVLEGYSICSAILHTKCKVDTYCGGMAASIAGIIYMCGRVRYMADYAIVMIHNPYSSDGKESNALNKIRQSLIKIIVERTGLTTERVEQIMNRETYIDISEAIDLGVCTDILFTDEKNKGRLEPMKNQFSLMMNKIKNQQKETTYNMADLKKINSALSLQEEASDKATLEAIEGIQKELKTTSNSLKLKEEEATKLSNELIQNKSSLEKKQAEYDAMKEKCDKAEKDLKDMKEAKDKEEKDAKVKADLEMDAECSAVVAKVAVAEKITDAAIIEKHKENFKKDPSFYKGVYAKILGTTKAAKFADDKGGKGLIDGQTVAARKMQEVNARLSLQQN